MSASTEALIVELIFSFGAIVTVGGIIGLLIAKGKQKTLRPAMTIIISGAGLVIIATLLNVLLFKSYDHVQVKKDQYYEMVSLTANMHTSLASSQAANQPVTPTAKKASRNVTYLIKHTHQPKASLHRAQAAQRQLTTRKHPDLTLVKRHYRFILNHYVAQLGHSERVTQRLSDYAYRQAVQPNQLGPKKSSN
ncbi:hypothetical protein [Levilactobacillus tujiorum]|uniref:hypothetical protein n=1 Tax=Levilactobacillus tujiorum TaxID=2912243 RepID=UPI00145721CD|nr:hypothetical protein [Levilactobacillus tujiorum]NLR33033.1 hypothetical protein [Levilactobacillus tujiorum]